MGANLLPRDGVVHYVPGFLGRARADALLDDLLDTLAWRAETALLFGRRVALPRLTAWYGPVDYAYSGVVHRAAPLPEPLRALGAELDAVVPGLDCVLANRYRDGRDHVGFHADDEPLWGDQPAIASLSLGGTRRFVLKHRHGTERLVVPLEHGSLLVMSGRTQECWLHAVARTATAVGERVNLTFRRLAADRT